MYILIRNNSAFERIFYCMKLYERVSNRNLAKVKKDIIDTKKVLREDIYEIIKGCKTRKEAIIKLKKELQEIPEEALNYQGSKPKAIARIINDIASYED